MAARTSGSLRISLRPGIPAIPGIPPGIAPGNPPENPKECMMKNIYSSIQEPERETKTYFLCHTSKVTSSIRLQLVRWTESGVFTFSFCEGLCFISSMFLTQFNTRLVMSSSTLYADAVIFLVKADRSQAQEHKESECLGWTIQGKSRSVVVCPRHIPCLARTCGFQKL